MIGPDGSQIIAFENAKAFEDWMKGHHADTPSIWIRYFKKSTGLPTIKFDEALDVALCYGWIDGQAKGFDDKSHIQRYTPRRKGSTWSKKNTENVERLIKLGKMKPSGLLEVEMAKKDGRWERAYESSSTIKLPEDFVKTLNKNKKAKAFFDGLNRANFYAIAYRLTTAKTPVTYEIRKKMILERLEKGEKFH